MATAPAHQEDDEMVNWTAASRETIGEIARRQGFGEAAGAAMAEALAYSGGAMAQFSHPELGGMGQWSRGGMLMIGDMFNNGLKARVNALADDLANALSQGALSFDRVTASGGLGQWWPEGLGTPSSSGSQNGRRYAVFPAERRLAIETDGHVRLYDTGDHRLGGVSQQQGSGSNLSFGSDRGTVGVGDFFEIVVQGAAPAASEPDAPEPSAAECFVASIAELRPQTETPRTPPEAAPGSPSQSREDPIALIQRLAELKSAGILTDEEFSAKKAELLARI